MSKTLLLLGLLFLSGVFACHPSCVCTKGQICDSCVDPHSEIDSFKRSCPCTAGYYTSSKNPFACSRFININDNGDDTSTTAEACSIELSQKVSNIVVNCDSFQSYADDQSNIINNSVTLDLSHASIDPTCEGSVTTSLLYQDPTTSTYIPLDAQYFTVDGLATKIAIPLVKLNELFGTGPISDLNQFTNTAHFQLNIGVKDTPLRQHKWDLFVYTNRDQVATFTVQVTPSSTEGCQEGQECIVIADVDTQSIICADETCETPKDTTTATPYVVGDSFIAKISFKDPTYTKNLKFLDLYFKNDEGKVFKFTDIVTATQKDSAVIVKLPLVEPANQAVIQVNLIIEDATTVRRRSLETTQLPAAKATFTTSISSAVTSTNDTIMNTSSLSLAFGIVNAFFVLIALI